MCFSAEASFGLGAALLPAGIYCIDAARRKSPRSWPWAWMPIAFGVQQISEGFVWVGISHGHPEMVRAGSYVFLFFALTFWPFWAPFSAYKTETRPWARRYIAVAMFVGLVLGLALYAPIAINSDWLHTRQVYHSIQYKMEGTPALDAFPWAIAQVLYLAVVSFPLVLQSRKGSIRFGIVLFAAAAVAYIFYRYAFASVWCFFAAIISLGLCSFFWRLQNPDAPQINRES
ncbi:MAG: DUF6629 family protein [Gemmataceae bacterium]